MLLFVVSQQSDRNKFEIGMALEADDLKKSGKVCVATVADKMGDRILVHFDGWDDRYDYWVSIFSNYIHPVNWHKENNDTITAPPGKTIHCACLALLRTDNCLSTP